jgi:DUF4097 and DUF4098 domain-containing protein YvlB
MAMWTYRALAILGCALATTPLLAAEKTFDQRFTAPPGGQLTLDADVGSVAIVGHDSRELIVHAEMSGSSDFLAHLRVSAVQTATGVTVTERATDRTFFNWFEFGSQRVRFAIEVPRDYPVDIHTSGGSIDAKHLKASLHGRTSGGSIEIDDVTGSVSTHTSGGSIEASQLDGPTELRTSGGSIKVAHCTGDLDVRTSGGGIHLEDIDGRVTAKTSGGGIKAQVRSNRGISLKTSGGGITLLLPANVHASIDARTSGGRAKSAIPLSNTEIADRNRLQGEINGGGEPVLLRTSGGAIRIAALSAG